MERENASLKEIERLQAEFASHKERYDLHASTSDTTVEPSVLTADDTHESARYGTPPERAPSEKPDRTGDSEVQPYHSQIQQEHVESGIGMDMVTVLRARLQEEEAAHAQLKHEHTKLQKTYHEELAEAEQNCLQYCQQIDSLTQYVEQLIDKNGKVTAMYHDAAKKAAAAEERIVALESNSDTLRSLVMTYLSEPSDEKLRSLSEQNFWDQLATPELLVDSEPPVTYPVAKLHPAQVL